MLDIEGAESALLSGENDLRWLDFVSIIIELHDRFERECSRNSWAAVSDFTEEAVLEKQMRCQAELATWMPEMMPQLGKQCGSCAV